MFSFDTPCVTDDERGLPTFLQLNINREKTQDEQSCQTTLQVNVNRVTDDNQGSRNVNPLDARHFFSKLL